ncbi:Aste57867_21529 [Aphanomyces stellatus]|uniref:Aste57867_21529 protein n=1 Tax=Aphanomyces stellatus TaxID=120398 RepID=A0A485LJV0_9STRA|nr:hypothetical protein As57867_021460 [Aphanomyces stellatus]VFT98199.1 Aste57867_21529 [Aphanomyces stellatus]
MRQSSAYIAQWRQEQMTTVDNKRVERGVLETFNDGGSKKVEIARYMVRYRKLRKADTARLKDTLTQLERLRNQLAAPRAMSWRDVARAMADARSLAEAQHKALWIQLSQYNELVRTMSQWVAIHTPIEIMPTATATNWRHVSLPGNPAARRLAKAWITQHMVHNLDRAFEQHAMPSWECRNQSMIPWDVDCVFHESGYTIVTKRCLPLATAAVTSHEFVSSSARLALGAALPFYDPSLPLVRLVDETDGETRQYAVVTPANNEHCNVLAAYVETADRHVFVMQQIQHDERCVPDNQSWQRQRAIYGESVTRTDDGTVWCRALLLDSHIISPDADVSLADDMRAWGIDVNAVPAHLHEARFLGLWKEAMRQRRGSVAAHRQPGPA